MTVLQKNKRLVIKPFTQAAKGQNCMLMTDACNHNPATVVAAHKHVSKMGGKNHDFLMFFCCSHCHHVYDNYKKDKEKLELKAETAIIRTMFQLKQLLKIELSKFKIKVNNRTVIEKHIYNTDVFESFYNLVSRGEL